MNTNAEILNDVQDQNLELERQSTFNKSEISPNKYSQQQQVSNLCYFYSNYGYCKYGQNCKFLHRRTNYFPAKSTQKEFFSQKFSRKSNVIKKTSPSETRSVTSFQTKYNSTLVNQKFTKPSCRYFKAGRCEKQENCLYNHDVEKYNLNELPQSTKDLKVNASTKIVSKRRSIPVCYYFKRGLCQNGDNCKYFHNPKYEKLDVSHDTALNKVHSQENKDNENISESLVNQKSNECNNILSQSVDANSESSENIVPNTIEQSSQSENFFNNSEQSTCQENCISNSEHVDQSNNDIGVIIANQTLKTRQLTSQTVRTFKLSSLSENEILELRNTEITQLKKRFPKYEENTSFFFDFEPSDPDWPYDFRAFHFQVTFPEYYPLEVCKINVLQSTDYIPEVVLRDLNQSICDWLNEKHAAAIESDQVVLLFRPFLKWFDRSLEELFNNGFKKVKQEETTNNDILLENLSLNQNNVSENSTNEVPDSLPDSTDQKSTQELKQDASNQKNNQSMHNFSQLQGTKVLFTGLELIEGVAALSCKKLAITINCIRCKTPCNSVLLPNKNLTKVCAKCSKSMELNFNPSILHQFSNILGIIYLLECQAVDVNLVECAFLLDCFSCAKQVPVDSLHYGQKQILWCKLCNQKLILSIESVKFQGTASTVTATNVEVVTKKATLKKGPVIKEGCPLPDLGACKHYKKSYRWLRFPCCGRLYPCDICHDEKEADHDMKYASRMICGFCSKEQPYSKEKPCLSCSSSMVNKSGPFWEGGKGCRNTVLMSRTDKHKYSGMNKTISKKSQSTGKKKK
ncbi:uncharacterized protein C18H10.09 [Trichonephila clavata]|uniref:Uncharacterized protein C18H10.09 n=1 Tax=Trichonephila clavata TaxID=2740835 RepID=A0A8X6H5G3_TRICU|nr:uncharacterized protein C18H10.09 [Trichonephila clavata]